MKTPFALLLFFISLNAHAFEFEYKHISFDIPDAEIIGADVANLPYAGVFLNGENWTIGFSDVQFEKDCALVAGKIKSIDCDNRVRIKMLDSLCSGKKKNPAAQIFFSTPEGGKILRQEFKDYILYSSEASEKQSALLVEKKNGRTIQLFGKFSDKHLKWLRLKPLGSTK